MLYAIYMWYVGLPDVDLDDLRANTEYQGYKATDPQVEFFWLVYIVYILVCCMVYISYAFCNVHIYLIL